MTHPAMMRKSKRSRLMKGLNAITMAGKVMSERDLKTRRARKGKG